MTTKFPILKHYRGAWPIHEIMKQFLGSQKSNFKKDTEAELEETREPDRKSIESYLNGLPSQKTPRVIVSDDDQGEGEDQEDVEEDWEEDDQEEEEVGDQHSQAKKRTHRKSMTTESAASKSLYLHDKTSTLNNRKPGLASLKIPPKTPHPITVKKRTEKENVMTPLAMRIDEVMGGKESKANISYLLLFHNTNTFFTRNESYR